MPTRPFPAKLDTSHALAANLTLLALFNEGVAFGDGTGYSTVCTSNLVAQNTGVIPPWMYFKGSNASYPQWKNDLAGEPCVSFGGQTTTSCWVEFPSNVGLNMLDHLMSQNRNTVANTTPWTIVLSVYLDGVGIPQWLVGRDTGGATGCWEFWIGSDNYLHFTGYNSSANTHIYTSSLPVSAGQWYQIAITYNGTMNLAGFSLYVNGVAASKNASSTVGTGNWYDTSDGVNPVTFGGSPSLINATPNIYNQTGNKALNGRIRYAALYWNRALSATELQSLDTALPVLSDTYYPQNGVSTNFLDRNGWGITADSYYASDPAGYNAYHLFEQDNQTPNIWASANVAGTHWLQVDMGAARQFNVIGMQQRNDSGSKTGTPKNLSLVVGSTDDGVTFDTTVATWTNFPYVGWQRLTFPTQNKRYFQLQFTDNWNATGSAGGNAYTCIGELRVGYNSSFPVGVSQSLQPIIVGGGNRTRYFPNWSPSDNWWPWQTVESHPYQGILLAQGGFRSNSPFVYAFCADNSGFQRYYKLPPGIGGGTGGGTIVTNAGDVNITGVGQIWPTGYYGTTTNLNVTGTTQVGDTWLVNGH